MSDETISMWQELDTELNRIQDLLTYARARSYEANQDLELYTSKLEKIKESTFWKEYKKFRAEKDKEIKALSKNEAYRRQLLIEEIREKKDATMRRINETKSARDYLKKEIEGIESVKNKAEMTLHTLESEFEVVRAAKQDMPLVLNNKTIP